MAKKEIVINCKGLATFALSELNEFQGELKERSPERKKKLRKSILKDGLLAPFFIWEDLETAKLNIMDGHSRRVILNELKSEGWSIPQIPIVFIEADNVEDAKVKLLAISSQYGQVTEEGLKGFLNFEYDHNELFGSIELPSIDMSVFEIDDDSTTVNVTEHTREIKNTGREVDLNDFENFQHKCPGCGLEYNTK